MSDADLRALGLVDAADALRRGELSSVAYARALLDGCIEAADLNAFAHLEPELVLAAAGRADRLAPSERGPLHGIPLAVKDNLAVAGLPLAAGTRALAGRRAGEDAAVVAALRRAGALVLGKTAMHELAMGWTGRNASGETTRNPRAPDRTAGGSSGGSAAALAAGLTPGALGSDTNGSIRIPASFCGVVGLRPTPGRHPTAGMVPLAPSFDVVGPLARTVGDVALLDAVMAGEQLVAPGASSDRLRLGVCPELHLSGLDPEVAAIFADARARLAVAGIDVVELEPDAFPRPDAGVVEATIAREAPLALSRYLAESHPGLDYARLREGAGAEIRALLAVTADTGRSASTALLEHRAQLRRALERCLRTHALDALVHPTLRMPAPRADGPHVSPAPAVTIAGHEVAARLAYGGNVGFATVAGLPALTLPAGRTTAGLPVGIDVVGRPGEDVALLALGRQVESALARAPFE